MRFNARNLAFLALTLAPRVMGADANCYDKGEDYYIPASDMLEAKKKALLCFFANISVKSSVREDNRRVDFEQETNLEAKSVYIDWSGLRRADGPGLFRWAIKDVKDNASRLQQMNQTVTVPVRKEMDEQWAPVDVKRTIVVISTEPPGASLTIDGVNNNCTTPCKLELTDGTHTVVLAKDDYATMKWSIKVSSTNPTFHVKLKETVGRIVLINCQKGTEISLDNNPYGKSPIAEIKVKPGDYVMTLKHPEYFSFNKKATVKAGENSQVECQMKPKMGGISISAKTSNGEPIDAAIAIDGVDQQKKAPVTLQVRSGRRHVSISSQSEIWEGDVNVEFKKTAHLTAQLAPRYTPEEKRKMEQEAAGERDMYGTLALAIGVPVVMLIAVANDPETRKEAQNSRNEILIRHTVLNDESLRLQDFYGLGLLCAISIFSAHLTAGHISGFINWESAAPLSIGVASIGNGVGLQISLSLRGD